MVDKTRIVINVSGEVFETFEETLDRFPKTLLGGRTKRNKFHCETKTRLYFDRNRICFEAILYYYQSKGMLKCPFGVPVEIFEEECRYFELPGNEIDKMRKNEGFLFDNNKVVKKVAYSCKGKVRNFLEHPDSSRGAKIFGIFSLIAVWISIITTNFETIDYFAESSWKERCYVIEFCLHLYFLIELAMRAVFSENKGRFFSNALNLIDIIAVMPYFILLVAKTNKSTKLVGLKALKVMRVVRLFRLSNHSRRISVVMKILRSSLQNFTVLCLGFTVVVFLGATCIYYLEHGAARNKNVFTSIPECIWWSVQTISSVGYGDMVPDTIAGRLFACSFMLFGAATISLPVLTIIAEFISLYGKNIEYDIYHPK